jgi:predicted signal transduction protein with EAL and GGDEF domain
VKVIKRAEKFINSLNSAFTIEQHKIVINASIGVVMYPEHGDTISGLLSHASFAMYEAKNSKLNVCVYNPANDHLAQGHLAMVADVRKALHEKQFELYYQPKINAASGQVVAVEALGRWRSKKHGNVPPKIFIGVLEQNGLINEYTYWAIETALKEARSWRRNFSAID